VRCIRADAALVVALLLVSVLYANRLAVGSLSVPALVVYDSLLFAASILCGLRAVACVASAWRGG